MNKEDINKLVSLAKIGDQRAFTKLFEYFYPIVFRLTKSSFKSNETAEDMAMEAFNYECSSDWDSFYATNITEIE